MARRACSEAFRDEKEGVSSTAQPCKDENPKKNQKIRERCQEDSLESDLGARCVYAVRKKKTNQRLVVTQNFGLVEKPVPDARRGRRLEDLVF